MLLYCVNIYRRAAGLLFNSVLIFELHRLGLSMFYTKMMSLNTLLLGSKFRSAFQCASALYR
jgi:hypothetical protein